MRWLVTSIVIILTLATPARGEPPTFYERLKGDPRLEGPYQFKGPHVLPQGMFELKRPPPATEPTAPVSPAALPTPPTQPTTPVSRESPVVSSVSGKRVALVIGNSAYTNATALPNPVNDAHVMSQTLREMGFDVSDGFDLEHSAMANMVRNFLNKAEGAGVALLYYAGHGMQVEGKNYLIPIDAKLATASDLNFETLSVDTILGSLDDQKRANIVILDACRDNPLARSFASRVGATRSTAVGSGLAAYTTVGTGTLIAYATAPGQVALDGDGANSPFTLALVKHMRTSGLEIRHMLTRVRSDVASATRFKQVPWDNSSLLGEVYLVR